MTQEEILAAVRQYSGEYEEWRKENDKHRQDDNSFPYYEEGYEGALSDVEYFLEHGKWPYSRVVSITPDAKRFEVEWLDARKEPQEQADPDYPHGVDLDVSDGALKTCTVPLPYPAKRIGAYFILCNDCGMRAACTTAGRPDDPRSIKIACCKASS